MLRKRTNFKGHGKPKTKSTAYKSAYDVDLNVDYEEILRSLRERDLSAPEEFIAEMRYVPHLVTNIVGKAPNVPNEFVYEGRNASSTGERRWYGTIVYPWNAPAYVKTPEGIRTSKKKPNRVQLVKEWKAGTVNLTAVPLED